MKSSWSYNLFFRVNRQVGKRKWLDYLMLFCAHWLIYVLVVLVLAWGNTYLYFFDPALFNLQVKLLLTASFFAIVFNWLLGWLLPHHRPIIEFPKIKQLFKPYKTWKSFPSDHTTLAFIFATVTMLMGAPCWFSGLLYTIAVLIGIARVYCGVHYPRDIVGGIVIGIFFSLVSYWLLMYITQPVYNWLIL